MPPVTFCHGPALVDVASRRSLAGCLRVLIPARTTKMDDGGLRPRSQWEWHRRLGDIQNSSGAWTCENARRHTPILTEPGSQARPDCRRITHKTAATFCSMAPRAPKAKGAARKKPPPNQGKKKAAAPPPKKGSAAKRAAGQPKLGARPMSALVSSLIPSYQTCGEAFPMRGVVRKTIALAGGECLIVVATNPGLFGTVMSTVQFNPTLGANAVREVHTIPVMAQTDTAGGPTSARAMKCSLVMTCTTPVLDRGGIVYRLHAQQRIKLPDSLSGPGWSGIAWELFSRGIQSHPDVRTGDLSEYGKPRELISNVVDQTRYHDFHEFLGTATVEEFWRVISCWSVAGVGSELEDRPMSTSIYVIYAPSGKPQSINFSCYASWYTRWALDTVPGQAMRAVPTAPAEVLNAMHRDSAVNAHTAATITTE